MNIYSKKIVVYFFQFSVFLLIGFFLIVFLLNPYVFTRGYYRSMQNARVYINLKMIASYAEKYYGDNYKWPNDIDEILQFYPHLLYNLSASKKQAVEMFEYHKYDGDLGYGFVKMNERYVAERFPGNPDLSYISIRFPLKENEKWNEKFDVEFPKRW